MIPAANQQGCDGSRSRPPGNAVLKFMLILAPVQVREGRQLGGFKKTSPDRELHLGI